MATRKYTIIKLSATAKKIHLLCVALCAIFMQLIAQELPIKPGRVMSFTTDEASYIDIDVSPDGKNILFTILGDLYLLPVTGGKAKQLTKGLAINMRPTWSPDGNKIAYISDISGSFRLNIRDITGRFHKVLGKSDLQLRPSVNRPLWTPDGNYIFVGEIDSTNRNFAYCVADGKQAFMASRTYISFRDSLEYYAIYSDSAGIYQRNIKTNKSIQISAPIDFPINSIVSPDGRWIAFIINSESEQKRSLAVIDTRDNTRKILVHSLLNIPYLPQQPPRLPAFSFSPDSKTIYIGYGGKIHKVNVFSGNDEIVPFTADVKVEMGPLVYNKQRIATDSIEVKYFRSVNSSPDGKQIVFMALNKLYVSDVHSGKPRELLPGFTASQFQPVFSPDGKWISFVTWIDTLGGQVWRVHANGGSPELICSGFGHYQAPAWSPDGSMIAVVKGSTVFSSSKYGETDLGELQIIDIKTKNVSVLAEQVPLQNLITFSENSDRIFYRPTDYRRFSPQNKQLKAALVSRDMNGKNEQIIALGKSSFEEPHYYLQRSISPNGKFIVYSMREDLYIVPVTKFSEKPIIFDSKEDNSIIRFAAGVDPHWEKNGMLAWTYGNQFFRIDPNKIMDAVLKNGKEGYARNTISKVSVIADKTLKINLKVPAYYGKGTLVLKNARIITMSGNKVIENGTIVISNGKIIDIGKVQNISTAKGVETIDLSGKTIMPGMIDMHMHVNCQENVYPLRRSDLIANLAYGVTTGRDPASNFDAFGITELLSTGMSIGPRLFSVGRAIFQYSNFSFDTFNDALAVAEKRKLYGAGYIKQYNLPNRLQKQWLLMSCSKMKINMTNEGNDGIAGNMVLADISMLKDGSTGIEHNPDWAGDVYKDVLTFFAKSGSFLGQTLGAGYGPVGDRYFNKKYWHDSSDLKLKRFAASRNHCCTDVFKSVMSSDPTDEETLDSLVRFPAMITGEIKNLGGKFTLGAHGSTPIGATAHSNLWSLVMGGFSNLEALRAATMSGAEALGVQDYLGSLEKGKIADLVILNTNPLEDIRNSRDIKYVIKDGVLYDGNTLDQLWPIFKKCPEWKLKLNQGQ